MRRNAPRSAQRIAYVMTEHPRLSQTFVAQEISELRANGWDIVPFSLNEPAITTGAEAGTDAEARAEAARTFYVKRAGATAVASAALRLLVRHPRATVRFLAASMGGLGLDLRALLWRLFHCGMAMVVREQCLARGVAHVHSQFGGPSATVGWLTHELDRAVGDGSLTWSYTVHGPHEFMNEQLSQLDRKTASAAFTVCISDHQRSQLLRIAGPQVAPKIHVVRVGIDLDRFTPRLPAAPHHPTRIVSVARLDAEKGLFVLLDAVGLLRRRGLAIDVSIVGSGPLRGQLEAQGEAIGGAVHVLGPRPPAEVAALLRDADVFCLPSFAEGIPVSIMEAMAIGVPVVTTYVNGIPELAVDGETARVVPAGNVEAFADAIASVIEDDALRDTLTAQARRRVHERHELHANTKQMAALFEAVVDHGR